MNKYVNTIRLYLQSKFIDHIVSYEEDGNKKITKKITMVLYAPSAPDSVIESSVIFYRNVIEFKVYYSATGKEFFKKSNHKSDLMFLINFINSAVWVCPADGMNGEMYEPIPLFAPRIYVDESDIIMKALVPYNYFEIDPLEALNFVFASIPNLLNDLSPAIYGTLFGKIPLDQAIRFIKKNILNEREITHIKKQ